MHTRAHVHTHEHICAHMRMHVHTCTAAAKELLKQINPKIKGEEETSPRTAIVFEVGVLLACFELSQSLS